MSYDVHIPRCTHIKTNGTQCGSPALRGRRFCFFHKNWQGQRIQLNALPAAPLSFTMPVLEDAESVQVALMQVMRLILAGQLDPKMAGLLLYALQTASANLRRMKLEPYKLEKIVIDPRTVGDNGLGDDAWSEAEFEEEEEAEDENEDTDEEGDSPVGEQEEQSSTNPADVARAALRASASKLAGRMRAARPERAQETASQRPPSPGHKRPPGADPNAIVVDFDGDSLARHLLEVFDFEPRPK